MDHRFLAACVLALAAASVRGQPQSGPDDKPSGAEKIRLEAAAVRPSLKSDLARRFVDAAGALPGIRARTLVQDPATRTWYTPEAADALEEPARAALKPKIFDETFYYYTRYGTPIAYARALDVVATSKAPLATIDGASILDYGYGGIGHLRLMASLGARTVGLEVDSLLKALYSTAGDTGDIAPADGIAPVPAHRGSITLLHGRFPADEPVRAAGLHGFDLFISKNTLKSGYIHPQKPVDKKLLVDLGVSDDEFVRAMFDVLRPGGLAMIYNLAPAPSKEGEPYKHWAEGKCPFSREMLEKAGFAVIEFDRDDTDAARALARVLGWDKDGMDVDNDLFAWYTLLQRPPANPSAPHPSTPRAPPDP